MPKIEQINVIDITPEKFIRACDRVELHELDLFLGIALAKVDSDDHETGNDNERKLSMKEVLEHVLENGRFGQDGISIKVRYRIEEFLNLSGDGYF